MSTTPATPPNKTRNLGDVLQEFRQHRLLMQRELQKIIIGQDAVIEQIFAAIFTRGQTQVLTVVTLGSTAEEQRLDSISPEESKRYAR